MCPFSPNHTRSSLRHFGARNVLPPGIEPRGGHERPPASPWHSAPVDPALAAENSSEALSPPNRGKGYPSAPRTHTHTHTHAHKNALAVSFSSSFPLGRTGRADKPLRTLGRPCALSARSSEARRPALLGPQQRAEAARPPRPLRSLRAAPSSLEEGARPRRLAGGLGLWRGQAPGAGQSRPVLCLRRGRQS